MANNENNNEFRVIKEFDSWENKSKDDLSKYISRDKFQSEPNNYQDQLKELKAIEEDIPRDLKEDFKEFVNHFYDVAMMNEPALNSGEVKPAGKRRMSALAAVMSGISHGVDVPISFVKGEDHPKPDEDVNIAPVEVATENQVSESAETNDSPVDSAAVDSLRESIEQRKKEAESVANSNQFIDHPADDYESMRDYQERSNVRAAARTNPFKTALKSSSDFVDNQVQSINASRPKSRSNLGNYSPEVGGQDSFAGNSFAGQSFASNGSQSRGASAYHSEDVENSGSSKYQKTYDPTNDPEIAKNIDLQISQGGEAIGKALNSVGQGVASSIQNLAGSLGNITGGSRRSNKAVAPMSSAIGSAVEPLDSNAIASKHLKSAEKIQVDMDGLEELGKGISKTEAGESRNKLVSEFESKAKSIGADINRYSHGMLIDSTDPSNKYNRSKDDLTEDVQGKSQRLNGIIEDTAKSLDGDPENQNRLKKLQEAIEKLVKRAIEFISSILNNLSSGNKKTSGPSVP